MSRFRMSHEKAIDARDLVTSVTIAGRLRPYSDEDLMKLARLAHGFRRAVLYATRMLVKKIDANDILRELRRDLNKAYGDSAFKVARALVEACIFNGGDPGDIEVKRLFIASEGESSRYGNRNVRLESTDMVKIKYPYDGSWLLFKSEFGRKYLHLIQELVELAKAKRASYGARIVFRDGKTYLHLSIPLELYLKHFSRGHARGSLVAGFDLNSDRVNMVIVDRHGRIRDIKTEHFPEVTSHGYPRNRARTRRLEALSNLLKYAYHHGVGIVVFENLFVIKKRRFTRNRKANRKRSRFAKKELLKYAIISSMKYGFKTLLINPRGTTSSPEREEMMRRYGLDRHTASAYLIALKGLKSQTTLNKTKAP